MRRTRPRNERRVDVEADKGIDSGAPFPKGRPSLPFNTPCRAMMTVAAAVAAAAAAVGSLAVSCAMAFGVVLGVELVRLSLICRRLLVLSQPSSVARAVGVGVASAVACAVADAGGVLMLVNGRPCTSGCLPDVTGSISGKRGRRGGRKGRKERSKKSQGRSRVAEKERRTSQPRLVEEGRNRGKARKSENLTKQRRRPVSNLCRKPSTQGSPETGEAGQETCQAKATREHEGMRHTVTALQRSSPEKATLLSVRRRVRSVMS